jgi:hypothetical protein
VIVTDDKYFWLSNKGPGNKEWAFLEDEPPTRLSGLRHDMATGRWQVAGGGAEM